jgi:2-amino-4-hydroxy-6-hydroxymethyldihydropteridine diphosphokinase
MLNSVYLLLGSNEGDRMGNLNQATREISAKAGFVLYRSPVYETQSWGDIQMDSFYNCAVEMVCNRDENELLSILHEIENSFGRSQKERNGPRKLDIDILFYSDKIVDTENLILPHPRMHLRKFALAPLVDIAPGFMHPVFEKPVSALLDECKDDCWIKKVVL